MYGNAKVYDDAHVYDDTRVYGNARVYGTVYVWGNAQVYENAQVYDYAHVLENAKVHDSAQVYGNALLCGNAQVYGKAQMHDKAIVYEHAEVYGRAEVFGNAKVFGSAKISEGCISSGDYCDTSNINVKNAKSEVIKDFVYKINESSKLDIRTNYGSVDAFFEDDSDDSYIDHECLVIIAEDTKLPILKLEKSKVKDQNIFKFIVDITNEDGDNYSVKAIIDSKEKFKSLLQSTINSLKEYPQFNQYANDLENCLY